MPILRLKEMRNMSSEERTKRLNEFRTEALRLKTMVKAGGNVENPARVKLLRKTIAQILTVESEEKRKKAKPKAKETKKRKETKKKAKTEKTKEKKKAKEKKKE